MARCCLEEKHDVDVAPLASKVYLDWPLKKLADAGANDTSHVFVLAELTQGGAEISRNLTYLAPVKEIHLKPATLKVESTGGTEVSRSELHRPFWHEASISRSATWT